MPLLIETMFLLLCGFGVGLGLAWLIWGRRASDQEDF